MPEVSKMVIASQDEDQVLTYWFGHINHVIDIISVGLRIYAESEKTLKYWIKAGAYEDLPVEAWKWVTKKQEQLNAVFMWLLAFRKHLLQTKNVRRKINEKILKRQVQLYLRCVSYFVWELMYRRQRINLDVLQNQLDWYAVLLKILWEEVIIFIQMCIVQQKHM